MSKKRVFANEIDGHGARIDEYVWIKTKKRFPHFSYGALKDWLLAESNRGRDGVVGVFRRRLLHNVACYPYTKQPWVVS